MSIKLCIFDLDGTITAPYFDFDAIRVEMGLTKEDGPVLEAFERMPIEKRRRAERILHFHEEKAIEESKLNPGGSQTLNALRKQGIKIGVLTRNRHDNAVAVLLKHDLYVDAILGREDGPPKPDAFGVLSLCNKFGVKPEETLMVGDFLFDLQAAKAANVTSVLLVNTERAATFIDQADYSIDQLVELLDIIEQEANSKYSA